MFGTIEIPIWLLILILIFAAVTFASHFLFPSVRWFLRRRAERLVEELNKRLERPIQPFKLARRTDMIQRLIYDPEVVAAVAQHAKEKGVREDVAFQDAKRYAREIVPAFSATAYFGFATRAAKWLSTRLYRVRLGHYDEDELRGIDEDATVVFVMNHRSNMDYVLVTYLAASQAALSYAVGEWARVWPLAQLIRAMGAYFIRRKDRTALYRTVMARYVRLATEAGVMQAVFPEGGLSLDGRAAPPKLGLLNYIIDGHTPEGRDIVFVPVALNYDRVIEDRILLEANASGERMFRGSIPAAAAFGLRYVWRRLRGKAHRFGYAAVSFGQPLSLKAFEAEGHTSLTADVAAELMDRIEQVTPVLPVPLIAHTLLKHGEVLTEEALHREVERAITSLKARGATCHIPHEDVDYLISYALRHLRTRRLVKNTEDGIAIVPKERAILEFYAASVAPLLDADAETIPPQPAVPEPAAT
ncbi:MAG: 1-acyl-sn-glycerol-3-phosphate acyltransferase [Pseudomonadota bacterium]